MVMPKPSNCNATGFTPVTTTLPVDARVWVKGILRWFVGIVKGIEIQSHCHARWEDDGGPAPADDDERPVWDSAVTRYRIFEERDLLDHHCRAPKEYGWVEADKLSMTDPEGGAV